MSNDELTAEDVEVRIRHALKYYPGISYTMLQVGIGPWVKPSIWRPVLSDMRERGEILEENFSIETPGGRYNSISKLFLKEDAALMMTAK